MGLLQWIVSTVFKLSGWKIEGQIPKDLKKAVFVGAPHTSNWDLFYTLGMMFTLNHNFRFVIKKEALVFPIKGFLLKMGAYPVKRTKDGTNLVEQIAKVFDEDDECLLCIAPEGTRKPVKELKSGFYYIAKKAQVPIMVGYLNCKEKKIHIGQLLDPNQPEDTVMQQLKEILKNSSPKNPKNFALI